MMCLNSPGHGIAHCIFADRSQPPPPTTSPSSTCSVLLAISQTSRPQLQSLYLQDLGTERAQILISPKYGSDLNMWYYMWTDHQSGEGALPSDSGYNTVSKLAQYLSLCLPFLNTHQHPCIL